MRALKENISMVQFTMFSVFSFMLEGSFLFTHSRNDELRIKIQLQSHKFPRLDDVELNCSVNVTSCKTCFNVFVFKYHGMVYHIKTKTKKNEIR